MKLNPRERAVAIALFSSAPVQTIADRGQHKIAGEEGTIAHRCGDAAKAFVKVGEELGAGGQVAAVALTTFCSSSSSFLLGSDVNYFAGLAFERAIAMLDYLTIDDGKEIEVAVIPQPESSGIVTAIKSIAEGDVAVEDMKLPKKTIELLQSLSTGSVDLTTARKIRDQDKKQSIEALKDIGHVIRKKILEAVDLAIGPEVAE